MTILAGGRSRTLERNDEGRSRLLLRSLPLTAFVADLLTIGLTALIAITLRDSLDVFVDYGGVASTLGVVGPAMLVCWVLAIAAFGGYSASVFGAGPEEYKTVANASLFTAAAVGVGCYLTKFDLSRGFFLLSLVVGLPTLLLGRVLLRRALWRAHRAGVLRRRVLLVGAPSHVDDVAAVLERETWLGYEIVGAVSPVGHAGGRSTPAGHPVVGDSGDLPEHVARTGADTVFFASGAFRTAEEMRRAAWDLEAHHTQVVVAPSVTDVARERVRIRPAGGLPFMHLETARAVRANRWAKRTFDVVVSAGLLVLLSPVLLTAALVVRLHDGGPVLFRQTRVGKDAALFACLKFRTMVQHAETLALDLQQEQGSAALLFKLRDDPRITRPGGFLRRFSIDELPQLFNVLRGDMSLVGPRPQVPAEVALYDSTMSRRLRVRPGMTGLWQVSGRSDLSIEDAMRLDVYYVDNWSMVQDLSILARTVRAVLGSRGAY